LLLFSAVQFFKICRKAPVDNKMMLLFLIRYNDGAVFNNKGVEGYRYEEGGCRILLFRCLLPLVMFFLLEIVEVEMEGAAVYKDGLYPPLED